MRKKRYGGDPICMRLEEAVGDVVPCTVLEGWERNLILTSDRKLAEESISPIGIVLRGGVEE